MRICYVISKLIGGEITRILMESKSDYEAIFKSARSVTRGPRAKDKERKKYGLKKARYVFQFYKR